MKEATDPQNITKAMKIGFEAQERLSEATSAAE